LFVHYFGYFVSQLGRKLLQELAKVVSGVRRLKLGCLLQQQKHLLWKVVLLIQLI